MVKKERYRAIFWLMVLIALIAGIMLASEIIDNMIEQAYIAAYCP